MFQLRPVESAYRDEANREGVLSGLTNSLLGWCAAHEIEKDEAQAAVDAEKALTSLETLVCKGVLPFPIEDCCLELDEVENGSLRLRQVYKSVVL